VQEREGGARTDVVRVELVDTGEDADGRRTQSPVHGRAKLRELAGVEVVDDERIELLLMVSCVLP
jgi:hypothetical protein